MKGYEVRFFVYADSQEEADQAGRAVGEFVDRMAGRGVAVTARRLIEATEKWGQNIFVQNYFK